MTTRKPLKTGAIPRDWASFTIATTWKDDERDAARRVRATAELEAHSRRKI